MDLHMLSAGDAIAWLGGGALAIGVLALVLAALVLRRRKVRTSRRRATTRGDGLMKSFGVWLWQNRDRPDAQQLLEAASRLGAKWPIASTTRSDYEASLAQDAQNAQLTDALARLWPAYEAEEASTGWFSGLLRFLSGIGVLGAAVALGGLILLLLFNRSFEPGFLANMATVEAARGLITFLFAVATVGIAVIIVLAVFLSNERDGELEKRFQRGKDVLTILIGVLGAIVGFYFGAQDDREQRPAATAAEQAGAPTPGAQDAATQTGEAAGVPPAGGEGTAPPPGEQGAAPQTGAPSAGSPAAERSEAPPPRQPDASAPTPERPRLPPSPKR